MENNKYNEALERARILKSQHPTRLESDLIDSIFPELAESEDEKIRKAILEWLYKLQEKDCKTFNGVAIENCIAWLEKQKDSHIHWYKSDNVKNPDKPYIDKNGMFYTSDGRMCLAIDIEKQKPINWLINGEPISTEEQVVDLSPKEWSEEEEKDIAHIVRVLDDCYIYGRHDLSKTDYDNLTNTLKSLCPQPKQEWSEEDKEMITSIIDSLSWYSLHIRGVEEEVNKKKEWLTALLERFTPQTHWKPSEEQMEALSYAIYIMSTDLSPKAALAAEELEVIQQNIKKLM